MRDFIYNRVRQYMDMECDFPLSGCCNPDFGDDLQLMWDFIHDMTRDEVYELAKLMCNKCQGGEEPVDPEKPEDPKPPVPSTLEGCAKELNDICKNKEFVSYCAVTAAALSAAAAVWPDPNGKAILVAVAAILAAIHAACTRQGGVNKADADAICGNFAKIDAATSAGGIIPQDALDALNAPELDSIRKCCGFKSSTTGPSPNNPNTPGPFDPGKYIPGGFDPGKYVPSGYNPANYFPGGNTQGGLGGDPNSLPPDWVGSGDATQYDPNSADPYYAGSVPNVNGYGTGDPYDPATWVDPSMDETQTEDEWSWGDFSAPEGDEEV